MIGHEFLPEPFITSINDGSLPLAMNSMAVVGLFAMAEQYAAGLVHDVLTLALDQHSESGSNGKQIDSHVQIIPPQTRFVIPSETFPYVRRADRITIRDELGQIVAIIEIVSPGNKESRSALRSFVEKAVDFLNRSIHLIVVDLFPPTSRDPQGIHKAIWDEFSTEDSFELPAEKPLKTVSYNATFATANVEPIAVGDQLPNLPLFFSNNHSYVYCPLEKSYETTWNVMPALIQRLLQPPMQST